MADDELERTAAVGVTFTKARIANPYRRELPALEIELLVDTGAIYSVVPADVLAQLGIAPLDEETFGLADGTKRTYPVGEAFFELGQKRATSKVVFGPAGVTPLLGALTLESMGLMVNPVTRELLPMQLFLARALSFVTRLQPAMQVDALRPDSLD
jgi:clan AA aspartic protease